MPDYHDHFTVTRPRSGKRTKATSKHASRRDKRLTLERLEIRQMLAASAVAAALPGWAGDLNAGLTYEVLDKAKPDQWYTGVGGAYVPTTQPSPTPENPLARVNYDYVWGLTEANGRIWYTAAANVGVGFGLQGADEGSFDTPYKIVEGPDSTYPGISEAQRQYLGDWRPPKIFMYDPATGQTVEKTPNDPLINNTLGLRSAGSTGDVVFLAGPNLNMLGVNMFAFDAKTGQYLGSKTMNTYCDIRQWVNVDGQLYAGTMKTLSRTGEGAVIRWTGTRSNPFKFQEVARLDLEAAYITAHEGRLYVSTWPLWNGTMHYALGMRSTATAGVWMSPLLGKTGLTTASAGKWQKVWDVGQYEVDTEVAKTYGGGALMSYDGYLYFGTLQPPGPNSFFETYPQAGSFQDFMNKSRREATLFRAKDFDNPATRQVELLYGDEKLWRYDATQPAGNAWSLDMNKMGQKPLFGQSGFTTGEFDPNDGIANTQLYTYTMAVYDGKLFVGTEDFSMDFFAGEFYVAARGDVDAAEAMIAEAPPPDGNGLGMKVHSLGADLWMFSADENGEAVDPVLIDEHGVGNPLNYGIRTMISTEDGLILGTTNQANKLTAPYDPDNGQPLKAGGFELIRVGPARPENAPTAITISRDTVAPSAKAGTLVGLLSALDPDPSERHTFALLDDAGGRFTLDGTRLLVAADAELLPESRHTILVEVTDRTGLSCQQELTINVEAAAVLTGIDVQGQEVQRSFIRYLDLAFASGNMSDLISQGRIKLTRYGLSGTGTGTSVALNNLMRAEGNKVRIDFGTKGLGGNPSSSAVDGYYEVALDLDGNGDFETQRHFYRLLGDLNGDKKVDAADEQIVTAAIRSKNLTADVNRDGRVDARDRLLARSMIGRKLKAGLWVDD